MKIVTYVGGDCPYHGLYVEQTPPGSAIPSACPTCGYHQGRDHGASPALPYSTADDLVAALEVGDPDIGQHCPIVVSTVHGERAVYGTGRERYVVVRMLVGLDQHQPLVDAASWLTGEGLESRALAHPEGEPGGVVIIRTGEGGGRPW